MLQCQLTDTALVFGPRYREGKLIELANDFVEGLYDDKENLQYINIVMRDFVTCEKSALTIRLNFAKGYASADSEFAARSTPLRASNRRRRISGAERARDARARQKRRGYGYHERDRRRNFAKPQKARL